MAGRRLRLPQRAHCAAVRGRRRGVRHPRRCAVQRAAVLQVQAEDHAGQPEERQGVQAGAGLVRAHEHGGAEQGGAGRRGGEEGHGMHQAGERAGDGAADGGERQRCWWGRDRWREGWRGRVQGPSFTGGSRPVKVDRFNLIPDLAVTLWVSYCITYSTVSYPQEDRLSLLMVPQLMRFIHKLYLSLF